MGGREDVAVYLDMEDARRVEGKVASLRLRPRLRSFGLAWGLSVETWGAFDFSSSSPSIYSLHLGVSSLSYAWIDTIRSGREVHISLINAQMPAARPMI